MTQSHMQICFLEEIPYGQVRCAIDVLVNNQRNADGFIHESALLKFADRASKVFELGTFPGDDMACYLFLAEVAREYVYIVRHAHKGTVLLWRFGREMAQRGEGARCAEFTGSGQLVK